jgi:hypothetical protein
MANNDQGESQDTTEATTATVEEKALTKADLETLLKTTIPALVNSTLTTHLKKTKNALIASPKVDETEATEGESKDKLTLASMKRELDAIKAERDQAKKDARNSKVISKVSTALDGKVNPVFKDLAIEQVIKGISFEDDEPSFTLGGEVYDVDSGIEAWAKHPSNKRFAVVQEARKQTSVSSNFSSQDLKETDMMGEDGVHLLASLLSPKLQKN